MTLLRWCVFCLALSWVWMRPASAHPMGNFSINHYARFEAQSGALKLRYILDFAEIPTSDQMARLDANGNSQISATEKAAYLQSAAPQFLSGLNLQINGRKVVLVPQSSNLESRPGAGGLPTLRVWVDTAAPLPGGAPARVSYEDSNFAGRTGWMEIIATAGSGTALTGSDAATTDISHQLTVFPLDAGIVPPRQNSARFSVARAGTATEIPNGVASGPNESASPSGAAPTTNANTPQNRFTQAIAETNLTPALVGWGLLFAFAFGAVHALSPGHGKTMVAAYLVGSRGTPKHAFLLGLVVTITHTAGVFALGLALLFASRYIVPEKLFPALSALSGLLIFGVGLWLFMSRYQLLTSGHGHAHSHDGHTHGHEDGDHSHSHEEEAHVHAHGDEAHAHGGDAHTHSHGEHAHDEHSHAHASGLHVHSHGGKAHSHAIPEGPITTKTLVALGISGGIVPCPEALVVLLAAIKLHRIGYGMVLITAFSIGLAAALIAIGMLVVSARERLSKSGSLSEGGVLTRYLPLGSAAAITIIGAALTLQATLGKP